MTKLSTTIAELAQMSPCDLGVTDWFHIRQGRVDTFADATDDHQWIHVDAGAAAKGPFGTTIAHGYLTLSLIPRLLEDLLLITDEVRGTNYGLDRVRFTNIVPVDATIRLAASVVEATLSDNGDSIRYRVRVRVEIENIEKPALIGDVILLSSKGA